MAPRIRTTKTLEQRRAEAEALHATIAAEVDKLREPAGWTRFLDGAHHLNRYSLNNVLLVLGQCPEATAVAGYRTWQERGFQVRKGEKAIRIFGGRPVTETVEDPTSGEETSGRRMLYFAVPVFDISQCDPIDPERVAAPVVARRLTGEDAAGIQEAVTEYLTTRGWAVTLEPIAGDTNGYTTMDGSRRVVIDSRLAPGMRAKVALHETAHVLLHVDEGVGEYVAHRGIKETEAESVAYVTAGLLGLDTAEYSIGYVAGWSGYDATLIKDTAARVLRCANELTDALTSAESEIVGPAGPTAGLALAPLPASECDGPLPHDVGADRRTDPRSPDPVGPVGPVEPAPFAPHLGI